MAGRENTRSGNKSAAFQPYGLFKSKDGYDVALGAFGHGVYKRAIQAMGLDLGYYNFKDLLGYDDAKIADLKEKNLI